MWTHMFKEALIYPEICLVYKFWLILAMSKSQKSKNLDVFLPTLSPLLKNFIALLNYNVLCYSKLKDFFLITNMFIVVFDWYCLSSRISFKFFLIIFVLLKFFIWSYIFLSLLITVTLNLNIMPATFKTRFKCFNFLYFIFRSHFLESLVIFLLDTTFCRKTAEVLNHVLFLQESSTRKI